MSPLDDSRGDSRQPDPPAGTDGDFADRLAALERLVLQSQSEIAELRRAMPTATRVMSHDVAAGGRSPFVDPAVADALRRPPRDEASASAPPTFAERLHSGAALSGVELESLVGRYGTLALAALVILMAVGAVIRMAVERGLLTPEVRVVAGLIVAALLAAAGLVFRQRGDVRYGGVLLAVSLAVIDLVAWGAGPRFHIVSTVTALSAVDLVAVLLAALALHDDSEFVFSVAVAGALSAPFVTSDGGGTALALLLYGGSVMAGALRAVRDPEWWRAFAVLVAGALVYSLAAASMPASAAWYGPYLVSLFAGSCAAAALLFGEPAWRSELPRSFMGVAVVGMLSGWYLTGSQSHWLTAAVALVLAGVTYAGLAERQPTMRLWTASALLLPLVSAGVAYSGTSVPWLRTGVFALWTVLALAAWRLERARPDHGRAGAHLLTAAMLGCLAITARLWSLPLPFVASLALRGVVVSALGRGEESTLPLAGVVLAGGGAALSAFDQLASRSAYSYTPFLTRSSASALCASVGIAVAGELIGRGRGAASLVGSRSIRLGVLIGFLIVWGRMEVAQAYTPDLAGFLLTSYYAGCGVASIVAGRRLGIGRLRVAGLGLALYAAFKAVVEVTDIGSVGLRVGSYGAVGMFLLGAGYLYRESGGREGRLARGRADAGSVGG
ncbi:hypothetical protein BH11GEM1_BH11GEM1_31560 [soil metagenome]